MIAIIETTYTLKASPEELDTIMKALHFTFYYDGPNCADSVTANSAHELWQQLKIEVPNGY